MSDIFRTRLERIERFLMLASDGGSIVSTNGLTQLEISKAHSDWRLLVLENGLGFVYVPAAVPATEYAELKRLRRELEAARRCMASASNILSDHAFQDLAIALGSTPVKDGTT